MEFKDSFSIFNLFLDKKVKITVDQKSFYIRVPTIKEFSLNEAINSTYHMWTMSTDKMEQIIHCKSSFEFVNNILFQLGIYKEYNSALKSFKEGLYFFIPDIEIDYKNKKLIVDDITITQEVWEYILHVLRLSSGQKVEKPRTFASED